jgi:Zn-dependent protease
MLNRNEYDQMVTQIAGRAWNRGGSRRRILRGIDWRFVAGFVAAMVGIGAVLWVLQPTADLSEPKQVGPLTLLFVLIGWVFSLCLHEFSHAATAVLGGDDSLSTNKYLSFNPLDYVNPLFSIVLPLLFLLLGGIGLPGGAVYLDRRRLRNSNWNAYVSLAGPLANVVFVLLLIVPFQIASRTGHDYLAEAIAVLALFEIFAIILNLLPIPPLDGFHAIQDWLPSSWQNSPWVTGNYGVMLLFLAFWTIRPLSDAFFNLCLNVALRVGFDVYSLLIGYANLFFFRQ